MHLRPTSLALFNAAVRDFAEVLELGTRILNYDNIQLVYLNEIFKKLTVGPQLGAPERQSSSEQPYCCRHRSYLK